MLSFDSLGRGVYKIYNNGNYLGALSRSGKVFLFIPEPFITITLPQLEEILEKAKELEACL